LIAREKVGVGLGGAAEIRIGALTGPGGKGEKQWRVRRTERQGHKKKQTEFSRTLGTWWGIFGETNIPVGGRKACTGPRNPLGWREDGGRPEVDAHVIAVTQSIVQNVQKTGVPACGTEVRSDKGEIGINSWGRVLY